MQRFYFHVLHLLFGWENVCRLTGNYHCEWRGVVKLVLCAVLSLFGSVREQWRTLFSSKRPQMSAIVGEDLESLSESPGRLLLKRGVIIVTESAGAKVFSNQNKFPTRATHRKAIYESTPACQVRKEHSF